MRRALVVLALPLAACSHDDSVCGDGFSAPGQVCFEERETGSSTLLALGDANLDLHTDALTLVSVDPPRIGIQLGQNDGTFAEPRASVVLDHIPYGAAIGNVDHEFGQTVLLWGHGDTRDEVCAFDVDAGGGLTPSWCYELPGVIPYGSPPNILTGHFGADGEAGFAVRGVDEVVVVTNPRDVPTEHRLPIGIGPGGQTVFIAADLDCDHRHELLWFSEEGQLQRHAAPWQTPRTISTHGEPGQVWAADIDADGCDDLLSYGTSSDGLELELYRSTGVHTVLPLNLSHRWYTPEVADLDADGHDDFLLTDDEGSLVYWGHSLTQANPGRAEPIASMALDPFSWFDVVDVNGDGADDLLTLFQSDSWVGELNPIRMAETLLSDH